jgi:hypothetical protein
MIQNGPAPMGRYAPSRTVTTKTYRVILKDGKYAIHEVFYDEEGPKTQFAPKATRLRHCVRNWSTTSVPLSGLCWSMRTWYRAMTHPALILRRRSER